MGSEVLGGGGVAGDLLDEGGVFVTGEEGTVDDRDKVGR